MKLEVTKPTVIFAGLVWLFLAFSFVFNLFGAGLYTGWFDGFQADSSAIIEKTALCKGKLPYDGPVIPAGQPTDYMAIMTSDDCSSKDYVPYDSQYGLQARSVSLLVPLGSNYMATYFHIIETLLGVITAFILTLVILKVKQLFGKRVAIVTTILVGLSVWIIGYARNLYWVEPLMIAPFALAFLAYPWFKQNKKLWVFYVIELLLLFAKLLNGYEHISTISLSVFVPIVFYEMTQKSRRIFDLWKQALLVVGVTVVAFTGAFASNVAALSQYYGSTPEAIEHIERRSKARSAAGIESTKKDAVLNFESTLPSVYNLIDHHIMDLDSLKEGGGSIVKYAAVSVINYLLLPAIVLPITINGLLGVILQSILFWVLLGGLSLLVIKQSKLFKEYYRPLFWSYWASLAGALSWLVLMPGHTLPHSHLNAIVFYLPLLLFCYISVGIVVSDYVATWKVTRRK